MTTEKITAAFEDYVLSLGPAEHRTMADCQAILGAYEMAIRVGGEPESLERIVSPMRLGADMAARRYAAAAPVASGPEIALPRERG